MLHAVNPPGSNIPGISQGMIVETGRLLVLSRHVPMRSDGSVIGPGPGLEAQMEQVFRNLLGTLEAAGAGFGHVA